jgi:hypothetical protein
MRGMLVGVQDGADNFGSKDEGSGGGGLKIKSLQSEFKHPRTVVKLGG